MWHTTQQHDAEAVLQAVRHMLYGCGLGQTASAPASTFTLQRSDTNTMLQAVCHMLYGCGALRHDPGPLLQAITNDMLRRPAAYEQRDWVRILWAFGTLNYSPGEQLFNAFHRQVCSQGFGG